MQHLKFAGTVQRYVLIRHGGQAWVFVQPRSKKEVETRGGGTLGISGWGCGVGILEPLTYTRASSAEFCYPILE